MIETSVGAMVVDLYTEQCPQAAKNFLKLCKVKYYNNCLFFNVQVSECLLEGDLASDA
jgi:peptidyl-prolyl cis-trans isomerase-like 4